jgi:hypothetical protein
MSETDTRCQHVVLCEGYDDRAFWAQWLTHMPCRDLGKRCKDPWGRRVGAGQFGFQTPAGVFVRIQPYDGVDSLTQAVRDVVNKHCVRPVFHLLVNLDADDTPQAPSPSADDRVATIVGKLDANAERGEDGAYRALGMRIAPVIWRCDDPAGTPGVPDKQTLERLVTASIAAAYPGRAPTVATWLEADPRHDNAGHKHHAYSYLAKWYAEHGCNDFYREVWRDPRVAAQLELRLKQSGAWAHVQAMCDATP